jgi:hypothetical protein
MAKRPKAQSRVTRDERKTPSATTEFQAPLPADDGKDKAAQSLGRRGGNARAKALSAQQRAEGARKAAKARWHR